MSKSRGRQMVDMVKNRHTEEEDEKDDDFSNNSDFMTFDMNEIDDVITIEGSTVTVVACVPNIEVSSEEVASVSKEDGEINNALQEVQTVELHQNIYEETNIADVVSEVIAMSGTESNSELADDPDYRPIMFDDADMHTEFDKKERKKKNRNKRRRKADPKAWEKNRVKNQRMKGEEYTGYHRSKDGKVTRVSGRKARHMGPPCNSKVCKGSSNRHCFELTEELRGSIFHNFWKDLNWDQRKAYVASHVDLFTPKKQTIKGPKVSRRSGTYVYSLKIGGVKKIVCKQTFLNTLGIKEWMAHNWIKRNVITSTAEATNVQDGQITQNAQNSEDINSGTPVKKGAGNVRGKEKEKLFLRNFLDSIPRVPSHYCRKDTSKLYLEPIFSSKKQLYDLYLEKCRAENMSNISYFTFSEMFEEMKFSLYQPKKDMCDTCSQYKVGNITELQWKTHENEKNRASLEKERDKSAALQKDCHMITMDLQSVKTCPFVQAGAVYYKTKLCCHNFTIFNVVSHQATNYWWNEAEGDLVASVFASCLVDYLEEHCLEPKLPIVIYSDGCVYQNKNSVMANALLRFSNENDVEIVHKYLVKGHSQMECDSVHATIERKLKNRDIYLPSDYVRITREARKNPCPYDVKYLSFDFFKDYSKKTLQYYESIRPGRKIGDPTVNEVRAFQYRNGRITFKLSFDQPFQELPQRPLKPKENEAPQNLYSARLKIPEKKWRHLQELKSVIPKDCHEFYDNLPH